MYSKIARSHITLPAVAIACLLTFTACDTEGDSERELEAAARETEQAAGEAAREIGTAFEEVDLDADGTVDQEDWNSWWDDNDWFSNWDLDTDGYLNENEFRTVVQGRAFGENFDTSVFTRWDQDGDERLSEDELRSGAFDWMDEDGNDQVTDDEWRFEVNA